MTAVLRCPQIPTHELTQPSVWNALADALIAHEGDPLLMSHCPNCGTPPERLLDHPAGVWECPRCGHMWTERPAAA